MVLHAWVFLADVLAVHLVAVGCELLIAVMFDVANFDNVEYQALHPQEYDVEEQKRNEVLDDAAHHEDEVGETLEYSEEEKGL